MASEMAVRCSWKLSRLYGVFVESTERAAMDIIDAEFAPVLAAKDAEIERLKGELAMSAGAWRELTNSHMVLRSERDALAAQVADLKRVKIVAHMYRLALVAIAKDDALKCRCGVDPYTDGEDCPRCTAIVAVETPIAAALQEPSRDE